MQLGQPDRERQAEPGAVMLAGPRAGDLAEAGHRQRDLLGIHADPVIDDIDRHRADDVAHHDRHLAAGMAELDRVDQEIEHDLLELARIGAQRRNGALMAQ